MTFDQSDAVGQANLDSCIRGNSCTVTPAPYTLTGNQSLSDTTYLVYGYSQSATVATVEKRLLAQNPVPGTTVGFDLIANPYRPNDGILERFEGLYIPIVGVTFNGATPTDTGMPTVNVAREYDGWADFPTNPLNLLRCRHTNAPGPVRRHHVLPHPDTGPSAAHAAYSGSGHRNAAGGDTGSVLPRSRGSRLQPD